ncbi:MAG: transcriptional repressor [Streptomyces sp.]|uniref:Fur family transcriptional regulator n=1 Tax=Streptomyces sp. TaxID=1931 RepID=UPI0025D42F03|nr:Fur family transcriptional regulator [Streptomyces sp.]MBW8792615.1 transcriptional repressor [Streptomyces sp.]
MGKQTGTGEAWQQELRARGYRLTPQRQRVLEAVGVLGHATPEAISEQVGDGVNLSTVYRSLELLEDLGLVRHTHLNHGSPSYSVAGSADHVHLVCRDCEAVLEVGAELLQPLVATIADEQGFSVDVGHVALFGRCAACANR